LRDMTSEASRMTVDRAKEICDTYGVTLKRRAVVDQEHCCGIGLYLLENIKDKEKAEDVATTLCHISNQMNEPMFALYEFANIGGVSPKYTLGSQQRVRGYLTPTPPTIRTTTPGLKTGKPSRSMLVTPAKNMDRFTPEAAEEAVRTRRIFSLSCMGLSQHVYSYGTCAVGAYIMLDKTGDVDKSRGLIDKAMDDSLDERLHDRGIKS
jgi:hypothetical protein